LLESLAHLEGAGLPFTGAGPDGRSARRPVVLERRGLTLRFWSYSYAAGQTAGTGRPGCAEARLRDILADVRPPAGRGTIDIVSLHMDAEFQPAPAPSRIALCRKLAEAGVPIVLCHHPHVCQGVERWGDAVIAYSLGNYVFEITDYMRAGAPDCHLSFHLHVDLDARGVLGVEAVPVVIDGDGLPELARGAEREAILNLLAERSRLLQDPERLEAVYREMIAHWSRGFFSNVAGAVKQRSWGRLKLVLSSLGRTPTKRRWLVDYLRTRLPSA
jgi:poly-gamma-glutamate synthesis protein (capsule biosynthesis protein)